MQILSISSLFIYISSDGGGVGIGVECRDGEYKLDGYQGKSFDQCEQSDLEGGGVGEEDFWLIDEKEELEQEEVECDGEIEVKIDYQDDEYDQDEEDQDEFQDID
ncbi:MAG: hypothetical protein EZS28_004323 [Streblomastix strix]|uniref:Uncharacterized protein n=1 Tax=Streblomastix strix TaxID=222440 RepID=A0A5J4WZ52_9EUKA|nr:MAG: hypothetical protein EZS28_004323 [Streblomastix strix]